jgi:TIR domain
MATPLHVLISFASADLPRVQPIADQLAKAGCHALMATDLPPADLSDALLSVDYLVVFISFASIESAWVRIETNAMLKRQNEMGDDRVIPARLDRVPRELVSESLLPLRGADFVESQDHGMASLFAALGMEPRCRADEVKPPSGATLLDMLKTDNVALHGPPGLRRALASPMHSTEAKANPEHVDVVRRGRNAIAD